MSGQLVVQSDLVAVERQLTAMEPHFSAVLKGSNLASERLVRTVLTCLERTPALLNCERPSIIQAAMTAAVLALEADGVTGQFYMIPFKNRAQAVIGYKGYSTLAARDDLTLNANVVREGDAFDFEEGSHGFVRHKRQLGAGDRRIVAAWATASHVRRPAIVTVLDIDEVLAVKAKSPGARKQDSPWNDHATGFPAMAAKTAKRRLARSLPLNLMQRASIMEEAFEERGQHSYLDPDRGVMIEGTAAPLAETQPAPPVRVDLTHRPGFSIVRPTGSRFRCETVEEWTAKMLQAVDKVTNPEAWERFRDSNLPIMDDMAAEGHGEAVRLVLKAFAAKEGRK